MFALDRFLGTSFCCKDPNAPNSVRNSTGFVCHMWFYILIATLEVDLLSGKCNQQDPLVAWNPFHVLLKDRKELDEDSLDGKEVRGFFCTNISCSISSIWSRWGGWSGLTMISTRYLNIHMAGIHLHSPFSDNLFSWSALKYGSGSPSLASFVNFFQRENDMITWRSKLAY